MKSVFDGWKKKVEFKTRDGEGGYCAIGWLSKGFAERNYGGYVETIRRIGRWIETNIDGCPDTSFPGSSIIWANNNCKLDIDGFRMVDLLTQGYVPTESTKSTDDSQIEMEALSER